MPPDQRLRFHDREHGSPVDQPGEHDESDPCRIVSSAGFDAALTVERQLPAKKEILGRQLRPRSEAKRQKPEGINQQADGGPPHDRRGPLFPHAEGCHNARRLLAILGGYQNHAAFQPDGIFA